MQFTAHAAGVSSIAYSPDGNTIATVSQDGTAELWDGQTGTPKATITKHSRIELLAYSPDGNTIATGESGVFGVWDARTGKRKTTPYCQRHADRLFPRSEYFRYRKLLERHRAVGRRENRQTKNDT